MVILLLIPIASLSNRVRWVFNVEHAKDSSRHHPRRQQRVYGLFRMDFPLAREMSE